MSLMWICNPQTGRRRSMATPDAPNGKYRIVPEEGELYVLSSGDPPTSLMKGGLDECKECAEACESGPIEFEYNPELDDLVGLPSCAVELITLARRAAISGERLKTILTKRLPVSMIDLELSILRGAASELDAGIRTAKAGRMLR